MLLTKFQISSMVESIEEASFIEMCDIEPTNFALVLMGILLILRYQNVLTP